MIEIHPEGAGFNAIVTYEDGNEPEVHECDSKGALIGFLIGLLPKNMEFRGDGRTDGAHLR